MKISDFFVFIFEGLVLHQTATITQNMPSGWGYLSGLAIGVEGTYLAFVVLCRRLKVPSDIIVLVSAAYQIAFLLIGIGVAIGWLLDYIFGVKRERGG